MTWFPDFTVTKLILLIRPVFQGAKTQQEILQELKALKTKNGSQGMVIPQHITAKEFMVAVKICRSKFDQLVAGRKIRTIKKKRKIYVPVEEVTRYFTDPSIQ